MDKETREFLENMQKEIQDFRKETNNRFDGMEGRLEKLEVGQEKLEVGQEKLEAGQEKLEKGQKEIKALIEELDPKNASRHLELKKSIQKVSGEENVKLTEALILRADLQKRMEQIRNRLRNNILIQEGEDPSEDPEILFQEFINTQKELTEII